MKIADKMTFTAQRVVIWGAAGFVCLAAAAFAPQAYAADGIEATPASAIAPIPAPTTPSSDSVAKNLSSIEDKVTESARSVVKRLDTSEPATLSDLNSARQTITRIDAMIDVEKRLAELQKLRDARSGGGATFASAIPASALMPVPRPPVGVRPIGSNDDPPPMPSFRTEISRISGHGGRYSAVLKTASGETKTVRPGDVLPGGETVRSITASSVELSGKKSSRTLRIKSDFVQNTTR